MKLEWSGTVKRPKFHGFSLFQRFIHQFLGDAHQSFSKTIALWMVWAAGDMVYLIEIQEVMKFPGTVTRSIVQS